MCIKISIRISGTNSTSIRIERKIALVTAIITHTPAIIFQYFNENKNGTNDIKDSTIINKGLKKTEGWDANKLGASQIHTGIASIHVMKKKILYAFWNFVKMTGR